MSIELPREATKRRLALAGVLGALLLGGCATTTPTSTEHRLDEAWLERASDCCRGLATLPLSPLAGRDERTLRFGPETPVHRFDTGPSPFHAMALPRGMGPLRLELISRVQRDDQGQRSLFAPLVLLLDETGAIQRRFDWQDFTYQPARGLNDDRLYLSLGVTPSAQADRLVVLTSDAARAAESELLHPARAQARARHLAEPAVVDPVAPHLASGEVSLRVRPLGESDGLLAPLLGSGDAGMMSTNTARAEPSREQEPVESAPLDWRRLMRAAVQAGDIELAMQLAERAARAGDEEARAWLAERLQAR
ncbi:MalM family protein [Halomonas sp. I1]|uniref:MalM family protein n=1 Tax=Halomonas sp. I1 TaxID=393536 RepID=UPI0028DE4C82|nr:MalM family protein [Halomonas sp. I1]MDT8894511.1 MalM family protein [Halomonas sp. I1]